jgi:hypothetical protein
MKGRSHVRIAYLWCAIATATSVAWGQASSVGFSASPNFYPITTWEPVAGTRDDFGAKQNGLASVKECGFNIAAFIRHEHVRACKKMGMRAMVAEPFPDALKKWTKLTDAQIEARARKIIGNTAKDPAIVGYFLQDEPSASEFSALGKAVQHVKRLAPGKLAYINLFPDYAIAGAKDISQLEAASYDDYLAKYVEIVKPQFISYDNYQIQYSNDQSVTATAASYYRNLLAVRKCAMENKLPFWNIVASSRIIPQAPPPSPASLQLQAFTTLAAGAQGLTWYTYYSHGYDYSAVTTSATRTATWNYVRMVNDQIRAIAPVMRKLTSTGIYFTRPFPAEGLTDLPGKSVEKLGGDSPLMVGEFDGPSGEKYAMAVNLSLSKSTKLKPAANAPFTSVRYFSTADASLCALPKDGALWLTAGQGVLLKLE